MVLSTWAPGRTRSPPSARCLKMFPSCSLIVSSQSTIALYHRHQPYWNQRFINIVISMPSPRLQFTSREITYWFNQEARLPLHWIKLLEYPMRFVHPCLSQNWWMTLSRREQKQLPRLRWCQNDPIFKAVSHCQFFLGFFLGDVSHNIAHRNQYIDINISLSIYWHQPWGNTGSNGAAPHALLPHQVGILHLQTNKFILSFLLSIQWPCNEASSHPIFCISNFDQIWSNVGNVKMHPILILTQSASPLHPPAQPPAMLMTATTWVVNFGMQHCVIAMFSSPQTKASFWGLARWIVWPWPTFAPLTAASTPWQTAASWSTQPSLKLT